MNEKPIHFDGSFQDNELDKEVVLEPFKLTNEIRVNLSGNPYLSEANE
jgi:hypothetical protein